MSDAVIVAIASLCGSAIGSFSGFQVIKYRVSQLEKKVEACSGQDERIYKLEKDFEKADALNEKDHRVMNHRLTDLEEVIK